VALLRSLITFVFPITPRFPEKTRLNNPSLFSFKTVQNCYFYYSHLFDSYYKLEKAFACVPKVRLHFPEKSDTQENIGGGRRSE
jgi:hypothetical protein